MAFKWLGSTAFILGVAMKTLAGAQGYIPISDEKCAEKAQEALIATGAIFEINSGKRAVTSSRQIKGKNAGKFETYMVPFWNIGNTVTQQYAITLRLSDCFIQKIELLKEY